MSEQLTQPMPSVPKPSIAKAPGTVVGNATFIEGGLGAVRGIRCAGVSAGFRRNPARRDLALIVTEVPAVATGVFTRNVFCAAPVTVSREHLAIQARMNEEGKAAQGSGALGGTRAIVLNSGNANASVGRRGLITARATAALTAQQLDCEPYQVLVASTGVIGVPLDEDPFAAGIPLALAVLGAADGTALDAGLAAAQAIMTTDTHPKQAAVTFNAMSSDGVEHTYTIGGMVKGSGMIQPNMATLLGVLATDADLAQVALDCALRRAVDVTLNKVTVDSDTSTNDSIYLLATGANIGAEACTGAEACADALATGADALATGAGASATGAGAGTKIAANRTTSAAIELESVGFESFVEALTTLCEDLSRQIAYDGEGATRLVTINLTGAASDADADAAGRAIANSPLVKTAIAGHDANWGRIAMAIGKSGATFRQEDARIAIMGMSVYGDGLAIPFDEDEALRLFDENREIVLDVDLGAGTACTRLWTCDLTHGYISINGDYRS